MTPNTQYSLFSNSRFYILVSSVILSAIVALWVRLIVPSDQLFAIRTEQWYGLLCILYWYGALVISPLGYVIGKSRLKRIEFSRRAIGVSAAYFASLHAAVALWGQLGGLRSIPTLSPLFVWSLTAGLIGVIVLILMAVTSFDRVISFMTFRRWKWLHRLVYIGGILAVLHVWSIGTHIGYGWVQALAFAALAVLSGLETYRVVTLIARKQPVLRDTTNFFISVAIIWSIWLTLIALIPVYVDSYQAVHDHGGSSSGSHNHTDTHAVH